ncbi:MAG: HAD family hydrolase [Ruminococcaceae bacterium]|nr:HAD family hydrolase [Oscillospiraceae bacterium]
MDKPRFSNVIFDLDGTLLDTLADLADSCNHVCAGHGWPTHDYSAYCYFIGNGAAKLVERAIPESVRGTDLGRQALEEFIAYYEQHKADKTCPYAGMPELVDELKAAGVKIAVLTNKPDAAAGPVMEQYYPGVFGLVQGGLPGVPLKPDPAPVHKLLERMGAHKEHTLFVGDSNVDIQTAKNSSLASCGVLWGFRSRPELEGEGADYIAATPQDLRSIILGK